MAKDFMQSIDNGYTIPTSISVGSFEATDIRDWCDSLQDFEDFKTTTGADIRYEGLITFEKESGKHFTWKKNPTNLEWVELSSTVSEKVFVKSASGKVFEITCDEDGTLITKDI